MQFKLPKQNYLAKYLYQVVFQKMYLQTQKIKPEM